MSDLHNTIRKLMEAFDNSEDANEVYATIYAEGFRAGRLEGVQAAKAALDNI